MKKLGEGGGIAANPVSRSASAPSYAAALKLGSGFQDFEDQLDDNSRGNSLYEQILMSGNFPSEMQSSLQHEQSNHNDLDLQYGSALDMVRPFRSYSEPNVRYEGFESMLQHMQRNNFDSNNYNNNMLRHPGSTNSSRSSSFYLSQEQLHVNNNPEFQQRSRNSSLANIGWLSTPPTNPLDSSALENSFLGLQLPPSNGNNNPPHPHADVNHERLLMTTNSPVPSLDAWTSMVSNQNTTPDSFHFSNANDQYLQKQKQLAHANIYSQQHQLQHQQHQLQLQHQQQHLQQDQKSFNTHFSDNVRVISHLNTETDELFSFNDLHLDSPDFNPNHNHGWLSNSNNSL